MNREKEEAREKLAIAKISEKVIRSMTEQDRAAKAKTTNFCVDAKLLKKGRTIQARHQKIQIHRETLMVFADNALLLNWRHPCSYLLCHGKCEELYDEVNAECLRCLADPPKPHNAFYQSVGPIKKHSEGRKYYAN